jgi:hypothetical protein
VLAISINNGPEAVQDLIAKVMKRGSEIFERKIKEFATKPAAQPTKDSDAPGRRDDRGSDPRRARQGGTIVRDEAHLRDLVKNESSPTTAPAGSQPGLELVSGTFTLNFGWCRRSRARVASTITAT